MKNSKSAKSAKVNSTRRSISYQDLSNSPDQVSILNNQLSQPQYPNQFQQMQQFTNTNQQFTNTNQFPQFQSQPFSQYSTYQSQPSQYQNTFQYPTQPLAYTPEDNDDADEDDLTPVQEHKGRVQMFTQPEDVLLAKAYVRVSENPMFGADQKFAVFWEKITKEYNESAVQEGLGERAKKSLLNRFGRMKIEMVTYNEAINFVDSNHHTGINETGRLKLVNDKFKLLNTKYKNRPFCFDHVVDILNKSSKFNYTTTRNKMPIFEDNDSSSSHGEPDASGHASTEMLHHSGDKRSRTSSQDVSSPSRPMGTKQAKKAEKLRKGKSKQISNDDEGEQRANYIETLTVQRQEAFTFKQELLTQKNKALQENFELQARKLAIKEKKLEIEAQKLEIERDQRRMAMEMEMEQRRMSMELEKEQRKMAMELDREQRIMSMDPDKISNEEQRARLLRMKSNIMEKWSNQGGY